MHSMTSLVILALFSCSLAEVMVSLPWDGLCANPAIEYFDNSWFDCFECDAGSVPDPSSLDGYGNAVSCMCLPNHKMVKGGEDCDNDQDKDGRCWGFTCVDRGDGFTVSRDGTEVSKLMVCGGGGVGDLISTFTNNFPCFC